MESRIQIAAEKKRSNSHNCAQAILHTYADVAGISEEAAMNIAGAFGAVWAAWKERVARLLVQDLSLAWSTRTK